jgi:hypothetical protein
MGLEPSLIRMCRSSDLLAERHISPMHEIVKHSPPKGEGEGGDTQHDGCGTPVNPDQAGGCFGRDAEEALKVLVNAKFQVVVFVAYSRQVEWQVHLCVLVSGQNFKDSHIELTTVMFVNMPTSAPCLVERRLSCRAE